MVMVGVKEVLELNPIPVSRWRGAVVVKRPRRRSLEGAPKVYPRLVGTDSSRRSRVINLGAPAVAASGQRLLTRGLSLIELPPSISSTVWDQLKTDIRKERLIVRRHCLSAATARRRAHVKCFTAALRAAKLGPTPRHSTGPPSVHTITREITALSISPAARCLAIRRKLMIVQMDSSARTHLRRATAFYLWSEIGDRSSNELRSIPIFKIDCSESSRQRRRPQDSTKLTSFTPPEGVLAAIKACPRGKACAPDGLCNDWYHDHAEELAPILAVLFRTWHGSGSLPPSFLQASVFRTPKTSRPLSGLDFRPIALLNTDYKIYSRVLLSRVRTLVRGLVAQTQYAFVQVSLVGFADDTTAYPRGAADTDVLTSVLARFATASGLRVNASKSMAIYLPERGQRPSPFPGCVAPPTRPLSRPQVSHFSADAQHL